MQQRRWDIFCSVIDNFGDIAVCWRLARQLAREHGIDVRLWVDDLSTMGRIERRTVPLLDVQTLDGVEVRRWAEPALTGAVPADVVIEAFGCEIPASYQRAMTQCAPAPVWLNLEYLSAEDWVEGCHGLPSIHPQLGLTKYFFFPGFSARTGGLIREAGVNKRRRAFQSSPAAQTLFWTEYGVSPPAGDELRISLFCYENKALPGLLDAWAKGDKPIYCAVPQGKALPAICTWSGQDPLPPGSLVQRGSLRIAILPFLPQNDYDRLLWACDLNFVRGEDSLVRAHWAHRPFVWQLYLQQDDAHFVKLAAFLRRFSEGLGEEAARTLDDFWHAWNRQRDADQHWPALLEHLSELKTRALDWAEQVASHGDLASKLLFFCEDLLK